MKRPAPKQAQIPFYARRVRVPDGFALRAALRGGAAAAFSRTSSTSLARKVWQ